MGVDLSDAALAALAKFMGPEFGALGLKAGLTARLGQASPRIRRAASPCRFRCFDEAYKPAKRPVLVWFAVLCARGPVLYPSLLRKQAFTDGPIAVPAVPISTPGRLSHWRAGNLAGAFTAAAVPRPPVSRAHRTHASISSAAATRRPSDMRML